MTKLTPYLFFDGSCAEAMKFYQPAKCIKFRSPMHRRANFVFSLGGLYKTPPCVLCANSYRSLRSRWYDCSSRSQRSSSSRTHIYRYHW